MKLVYDTYILALHTLARADTQVNVSRSLTALRSVFMSLDKTCPADRIRYHNKSWHTFYITMLGTRHGPLHYVNVANAIKHLQLMLGSKMYPEYRIASHAERFYKLRNSLGIQTSHVHALDITGDDYHTTKFVVGFDTDKMLGLACTGINTQNSLMIFKFKNNTGDYQASRMHSVVVAQQVLELSDTCTTLFD